ncbi:hypothetical protein PsYK624_172130 [Phanerochaete sordida]|uniref:Uncharacterized protein n=1 Tax=Phanerochaete sordida TaxID=48140 RepID=A0A9P3GSA9_9APHY|nr:hypothetical protein PsYK624_172130 [Phanerochaete sordida]
MLATNVWPSARAAEARPRAPWAILSQPDDHSVADRRGPASQRGGLEYDRRRSLARGYQRCRRRFYLIQESRRSARRARSQAACYALSRDEEAEGRETSHVPCLSLAGLGERVRPAHARLRRLDDENETKPRAFAPVLPCDRVRAFVRQDRERRGSGRLVHEEQKPRGLLVHPCQDATPRGGSAPASPRCAAAPARTSCVGSRHVTQTRRGYHDGGTRVNSLRVLSLDRRQPFPPLGLPAWRPDGLRHTSRTRHAYVAKVFLVPPRSRRDLASTRGISDVRLHRQLLGLPTIARSRPPTPQHADVRGVAGSRVRARRHSSRQRTRVMIELNILLSTLCTRA